MNSKLIITVAAVCLVPFSAIAADFVPLVGIPGVTDGPQDFNAYINALYTLSISVAALIAVLKIIVAGAKYMLDDTGVGSKSAAKEDIRNALVGLLIIISAVVILDTVNTDLTNMQIFDAEDTIAIDDTPIADISLVDALCNAEGGCGSKSCNLTTGGWTNLGLPVDMLEIDPISGKEKVTCQTRCAYIEGVWGEATFGDRFNGGRCWYNNNTLREKIDEVLQALIDTHCPAGDTSCNASMCDVYGDGGAINLTSCEEYCLDDDKGNGLFFDEATEACVFATNAAIGQVLDCEEIEEAGLCVDSVCVGPTTVYSCTAAKNTCLTSGGKAVEIYPKGVTKISCEASAF